MQPDPRSPSLEGEGGKGVKKNDLIRAALEVVRVGLRYSELGPWVRRMRREIVRRKLKPASVKQFLADQVSYSTPSTLHQETATARNCERVARKMARMQEEQ